MEISSEFSIVQALSVVKAEIKKNLKISDGEQASFRGIHVKISNKRKVLHIETESHL